ncbi:MAG: helicase [Homoserinimonas sp.]|nr:helicase [Homoserinimonas sp.]
MFLLNDDVIYSASDVTAASTCEWALMRTLDAKLGRIDAVVDGVDEMLARTAKLGDAHEARILRRFKATRRVIEFTNRPSVSELPAAADASTQAFREGADVVFQATFFDGRFLGYADFVLRNAEGSYEVYDTKLARKAKITALLQLAAYSEQLELLGIPIGENVHLILGDDRTSTHQVSDILPVYRKRRARLQSIIDERAQDAAATEWGDPRYAACGRCATCAEQVDATRDVLLVAGMKLTQRKKLREAGVLSIDQLASAAGPVPGMPDGTLDNLRAQARIQLAGPLEYEVYNANALAALPVPNPGDVFFDFEGDPLYQEGTAWGLDYLFGLVEVDKTFRAFWAHNLAEERQALVDFLAYIEGRRASYPGMHIYHYAAYEVTHLLSLAARHGVGEEQVDDLLRAHVLIDLYPIVRKGIRVGSRSYSIKKLEPLYMGEEHRAGVDNAADSITQYSDARALHESGATDAAATVLRDIEQYNTYDCVSTLRLRDWLLQHAATAEIQLASPNDLELDIPTREPSPVYLALAALIEDVAPLSRTADQTAIALASAAIDYHRREGKKFWQEHFGRLRDPVDEWAGARDVLIVDTVKVEREWAIVGRARNQSRVLRVTGELSPGSSFRVGHKPYLVYDPPFPQIEKSTEPGSRYTHDRAEITHVDGGVYYVTEKLRSGAERYAEVPMALAPGAPPRAQPQPEAIEAWGRRVLSAQPAMLPDAALDILRRQPPRGSIVPVRESIPDAIRETLLGLDRSYVAVQGPPGTGKTFTGSRVIADLVHNHGWRVGVVAQSHNTVENMLAAVVDAGLSPGRVGKKAKAGEKGKAAKWTVLDAADIATFASQPGFVFGGTAWDFSNAERVPPGSLDLLVIDEAGQFSLASTIASAVAAQRVLLLGDPQQLPQVSQGSHPEPVDASALGWLCGGHDVLPPEYGYFLPSSWRMHPAVCAPVSALSYEGKLHSIAPPRSLEGVEPGLHPIPVEHTLNSTSSDEEAVRVVELIRSLLGRAWTDNMLTRALQQADIIVVAAYNAQVALIDEHLTRAGFAAVAVGTVDKFQGKEAAVAIVSLAASSAEEVPRGLEFLLLANRLNVAISRAQVAAYLLYSPALTEHLPTNVETLAKLSVFIELVEGVPVAALGERQAADQRKGYEVTTLRT